MICMGGELRLKARAREKRAMARPSEMQKNKRKELELEDESEAQRAGGSEKRTKLNVVDEEGEERERGDHDRDHNHNHNHNYEHGHGGGDDVSRNDSLVQTVEGILEARRRKSSRPLPVVMGDKAVDLIALHFKVNSMGGYSKVTEGKLWGTVSDALELGPECGPGLKLVFVKYLKALDTERYSRSSARLDASQPSSSELRMQSGRHVENGEQWHVERKADGSGSDEPVASLSDDEIIGDPRSKHRHSQLECRQSSTSEDWATTYASGEHLSSGRGDQAHGSDAGPGASEDWYEGGREENVTLQRDALNGMMEWIKCVALSPGDSSLGVGTVGSAQDEDWVSQCQVLAAKVRSVLWKEPRGGDSSMQARPMAAAYYDEAVRLDAQSLERLRATRERLAQFGFQTLPGPRSNYQDRNVDGSAYWGAPGAYGGQRSGRQTVNYNEAALARYNQQRKRIPIGPEFQADEVPWVPRDHVHTTHEESGGEGPSGSDDEDNDESRWLGVRVWPQSEQRGGVDRSVLVRVGKGRAPSCECSEPGSINCVRAHIDAARGRLRMELGQAWFEMGFDQMGERVADHWTKDEERTFRLVARTHPVSKNSNFWDHLPGAFPYKTRRELNSYYFNVFMLRRRAFQNRLPVAKMDSDDDEGELPGESDDSGYDDSEDDDEEDEEDDDEEEDPGSEDMPGAIFPLKTPIDSTREPKYRLLPDFNYSPTEPEVARIDRAQIAEGLAVNHITDRADDSHLVLVWDDKHLESGSLVRDGVLSQEWQEPHWDERGHQQEAVTSTRQLSPPVGKDTDVRRAPALGDLWSQGMEMAPKREKDRLLSTNGMILELFGDDVSD